MHKNSITACVLVLSDNGQRQARIKESGAFLKELERLRFWLFADKVEAVAMEFTGVYWKPGMCWKGISGYCWPIPTT